MTDSGPYLVTGATGNTGHGVVEGLRTRGLHVRAACRQPPSQPGVEPAAFDWSDPSGFGAALRDVTGIYLVAPVGVAQPETLVQPFLEAALDAGVRRVVLLSSSAVEAGDPVLGQLHSLVAGMFEDWAVLRPSWFMQNFVGAHPVADAIRANDSIVTATGEGTLPFIDAEDIARVAVEVLTRPEPTNAALLLTGPQALSYGEVAAILTAATGRKIEHVDLTVEALTELYVSVGLEPSFAAGLAALDDRIRAGEQARVSDVVESLTGVPPRAFAEFIDAHAGLLDPVAAS